MSTPEINQVLAQMRAMSAQAQVGATPPAAVEEVTPGNGFGDLLKNSIDAVSDTQKASAALKTEFEMGNTDVDLAQVMVASQKASVSFQAMVQVRNKLVEAYKDIMNMPV